MPFSRQNKWNNFLIVLVLLIVISCSKQDAVYDNEAPQIQILEPFPEAMLTSNETINLQLEITENNELHEYAAVIRGQDVDTSFTLMSGHLHDQSASLRASFILPIPNATYKLTVKASDHDDNLASESIIIYSK